MTVKQYKGIWVRKGKGVDRDMAKDCLKHYSAFNLDSNSIVMDLGANIGGFGNMVMNSDAGSYIAYEPDPENFKMLQMNTNEDSRAILHQSVVSMSDQPTLTFHQNESGKSACSGTVVPKKRRSIQYDVSNTHFDEAFEKYKPTHLKMDIEGAEEDWLRANEGVFPDHVQEFALEIHGKPIYQEFNDVWYHNIIKDFDILHVYPNTGFIKDNSPLWNYSNLGIEDLKAGSVFGIDIFMRRK